MKKNSGKGILVTIIILLVILIIAGIVGGYFIYKSKTSHSNDKAQADKTGRYLTIINNTEQIINKVTVEVGNGTEINSMEVINPDEKSISIEIPKDYDDFKDFKVILTDRYNMVYKKDISNVPEKGRTEVLIGKDDYEKQKGDFWNKMDKFFNGDLKK